MATVQAQMATHATCLTWGREGEVLVHGGTSGHKGKHLQGAPQTSSVLGPGRELRRLRDAVGIQAGTLRTARPRGPLLARSCSGSPSVTQSWLTPGKGQAAEGRGGLGQEQSGEVQGPGLTGQPGQEGRG